MDRLYLKDPGGLLTPDAVRELAPHFLAAAGGRTVELHSHCTIGLAPLVYVEGVDAGFQVVHTAAGPLSRGTSQPEVVQHGAQPRGRRATPTRSISRPRRPSSEHFDRARARQGPARRRAAGVRRRLLPPSAARGDGDHHSPDARGAAPARAVRSGARGGHARPRRDGLSDPGHARLAVRGQPGRPQRDRRRALGATSPTRPCATSSATTASRPRRSTRRSPNACCRCRRWPKLRDLLADHARGRPRAIRPQDL